MPLALATQGHLHHEPAEVSWNYNSWCVQRKTRKVGPCVPPIISAKCLQTPPAIHLLPISLAEPVCPQLLQTGSQHASGAVGAQLRARQLSRESALARSQQNFSVSCPERQRTAGAALGIDAGRATLRQRELGTNQHRALPGKTIDPTPCNPTREGFKIHL